MLLEALMDLPEIVKEKLIELDDENNQLRAEVNRLRATVTTKDEILNELEEENIQLRKSKETPNCSENARSAHLKQMITSLEKALEEKDRDTCQLKQRIEVLTTALNKTNDEIDELRKARPPSPLEISTVPEQANTPEMIRLQEELKDALFELQQANIRINGLVSEKEDVTERAEAANKEAREMARHLKELREEMHGLEGELAESRNNVAIAKKGNSMFSEFADERLKLEADMKNLYLKYEAVRRKNYQLACELDEARLLALRRPKGEGTARCRCQELSPELIHLRGKVQSLQDALARARNEAVDLAIRSNCIDARLRAFYRALKIEMEGLRSERDKFQQERDKLFDEKAELSAKAANAEKALEHANDDIENLKLQLTMTKEREQKKDAERVSEIIEGGGDEVEQRLSVILRPLKDTPGPSCKSLTQTPATLPSVREVPQSISIPQTPLIPSSQNCSFNTTFDFSEKIPTGLRLKKLRFSDTEQNDEDDNQRRQSVSASELRRIARKQARRAQSKVLPIAEPIMRAVAKISYPNGQELSHERLNENPTELLETIVSDSSQEARAMSEIEFSTLDLRTTTDEGPPFKRRTVSLSGGDVNLHDQSLSSKLSDSVCHMGTEHVSPLSALQRNDVEIEASFSSRRHSSLDASKDFNWTALENVPEEKENDSSCKSSQDLSAKDN